MGLLLALLGSAAEDLAWPFQIGFLGSMGFGLIALELVDCRRRTTAGSVGRQCDHRRPVGQTKAVGATFWLIWAAWAWVGLEALMVGLRVAAGAPRFLLPGVALAAVAAGCAWADLLKRLPGLVPRATPALPSSAKQADKEATNRRGALPSSVVLSVAWLALLGGSAHGVATWARNERGSWRSAVHVQQLANQLPTAVSRLGGRAAIVRCGTIAAAPLQNPAVAWALDVPLGDVGIRPSAHGVVFATDGQPAVPGRFAGDYHRVGTVGPPAARWTERTTCWPDDKHPIAQGLPLVPPF
jgi:hypothetical protein